MYNCGREKRLGWDQVRKKTCPTCLEKTGCGYTRGQYAYPVSAIRHLTVSCHCETEALHPSLLFSGLEKKNLKSSSVSFGIGLKSGLSRLYPMGYLARNLLAWQGNLPALDDHTGFTLFEPWFSPVPTPQGRSGTWRDHTSHNTSMFTLSLRDNPEVMSVYDTTRPLL